jgi:glycosyltransferase involved in cell wall biosynthesis
VRIVFLTEYFRPFEIGGAERSTERLGVELVKAGIPVSVMTPNYGAPAIEERDGLTVVRMPFPQSLQPGQLVRRLWAGNPVLQLVQARRIASRIRADGGSLVHVQNSGMVVAGALAASMTRRPLVVTVRDLAYLTPETDDSSARRAIKWQLDAVWARGERLLKRRALRRAFVVFVSRALQELYVRRGIVDGIRTRVIYNIGPSPYSGAPLPRDGRTILFVGKLSTGKGLEILYQAAELVSRVLPGVRFELAGIQGVGFRPPPAALADMFTFHGRLDAAGVQRLMLTRAVLAAPAIWQEPLSRVLLEAMSTRLPIVATAVGGTVEALEHESSALLVPPGDAHAFASALLRVLDDPALAERLSTAAAARLLSTFSAGTIVPQVLALYRDADAHH